MEYSFNSERLKNKIMKAGAKNVLIQLPDGLKQDYEKIIKKLEGKGYNLFLWAGSCFGACDIPLFTENNNIDLIIHLGHEEFEKND